MKEKISFYFYNSIYQSKSSCSKAAMIGHKGHKEAKTRPSTHSNHRLYIQYTMLIFLDFVPKIFPLEVIILLQIQN